MTWDVVYYDAVNGRWTPDGVRYDSYAEALAKAEEYRVLGQQARVVVNKAEQER